MTYIISYILFSLITYLLITTAISRLYGNSKAKPPTVREVHAPPIRTRIIITFSFVLPFSAFSLLFLTYPQMAATPELKVAGHLSFAVTALLLPCLCFLIGYFYFRKVINR